MTQYVIVASGGFLGFERIGCALDEARKFGTHAEAVAAARFTRGGLIKAVAEMRALETEHTYVWFAIKVLKGGQVVRRAHIHARYPLGTDLVRGFPGADVVVATRMEDVA